MIHSLHSTYKTCGLEHLGGKIRALSDYVERARLDDYIILSTCNRAELYSTSNLKSDGFRGSSGVDALRHLLRVSAGLDSMLVGETEILSQVKQARETAVSEGHCSRELSSVFASAARFGAKARSKTRISEGKTSIASLAVDRVLEKLKPSLESVLVIGSGAMGAKIARALKNKGVEQIFLANRRRGRAELLASKVGGLVVDYGRLSEFLEKTQVVFTATNSPHSIINPWSLPAKNKILFVDLGVPPDVSKQVDELDGFEVVRLEEFRKTAEKNALKKAVEVERVEALIEETLGRHVSGFN